MEEEKIKQATELIRNSRNIVAFTGAGFSVPSGIPDFRSPSSGLWEKYDPFEVASIQSFRRRPDRFYEWIRPLLASTRSALPNPAHNALKTLEESGSLKAVITQNIDGLHEAAGNQTVLAVHGHTRSASCVDCKRPVDINRVWERVEQKEVPLCELCNAPVKPDVVLFGEMPPMDVMMRAQQFAAAADVMIAAGSSLEVFPANELPAVTLANGGRLIIINLGETQLDAAATVRVEGDVAEVLPEILRECGH